MQASSQADKHAAHFTGLFEDESALQTKIAQAIGNFELGFQVLLPQVLAPE
jgi:uncharacterized protein YdcH (DUF465 family)